jgi:hypothetical protein
MMIIVFVPLTLNVDLITVRTKHANRLALTIKHLVHSMIFAIVQIIVTVLLIYALIRIVPLHALLNKKWDITMMVVIVHLTQNVTQHFVTQILSNVKLLLTL